MTDSTAIEALSASDRFEIGVAILVVLTTLVAAGVGLLFAKAANEADEAAADALVYALEASASGVEADQRADDALTRFARAREQAAHVRSAREAELFGGRADATTDARRWRELQTESERALATSARNGDGETPELDHDSALGPEQDGDFPGAFRDAVHRDVHEQFARRDAANGLSAEWGQRTASYAAILTLLAVALYLFGFALTPHGRPLRGLFAAVATAFLCLGLIFGPVRALSSPAPPPTEAATEFALGVVAFESASDPLAYEKAERHLTRAISAQPDFVEAYNLRSNARFNRGTPQSVFTASLTTATALQRALADVRMARSLGLRTSTTLSNEGFYLFLLALRTGRLERLPEAVELTRAAVSAQRSNLIARFNLAVALLAAGDVRAARAEYRIGLAELVELDDKMMASIAGGALTDLELVATHGPVELTAEVRDLKELFAASMTRGEVRQPRRRAPTTDVDVRVRPGFAEVTLDDDALFALRRISVHWYHEEPQRLGWSHVPQLLVPNTQAFDIVRTPSYVLDAKRCLPAGRYRAEVYLDGRLVGSGMTDYAGADAVAVFDRDHDIALCRPVGWDEVPTASPLVRSYRSDDHRSGLHLVRLDRTMRLDGRGDVQRVLRKLVRAPNGPWRGGTLRSADSPFFTGYYTYGYRGGQLHVATTTLIGGGTVLAAVYGPSRSLATHGMSPWDILSSAATG